jgi:hypothetical protein
MALRGRCWAAALLLTTLASGAGCAARAPGATAAPAQTTRARIDSTALIERGCYFGAATGIVVGRSVT